MANSVTKAKGHDEVRGGRSVTSVHGSACNVDIGWGHRETSENRCVRGA